MTASGAVERHPWSLVETADVGEGSTIAAFARVFAGARIGRRCSIQEHTVIHGDVVLGDRVTVSCGVHLEDIEAGDDVFVGPNAAFARPQPGNGSGPARSFVRQSASIGANAVVMAGAAIGESAIVSPGAVVTRDVPANAIVAGNPAQIVGYVGAPPAAQHSTEAAAAGQACDVRGVVLQRLPRFEDMRGALTVAEVQLHVPFQIRRFFLVYDVPSREVRGEHAHYTLHQFVICVRGSCAVLVDDGEHRHEFRLTGPSQGIYLPPLTWSVQYKHTADALLLVLASAPYDAADYIREYTTFVKAVRAAQPQPDKGI